MKNSKIVLIGYMGCGKSEVGKKLSSTLGIPFLDLDAEIEKREGLAIMDIFSKKGEIYFRKKENALLKELLLSENNFVLATGGGTPCYGDNMAFIISRPNVISIYLKTNIEILTNRLFREMEKRPMLSHIDSKVMLEDFIRKHLFERAYYYNQASFIVENNTEIVQTVEKIRLKLV